MDHSVAIMVAQGINCVCIAEHFREVKAAGVYHNAVHANCSDEATAFQLRMLHGYLQLQKVAYVPRAWKEEALEEGLLKERIVEAAAQCLVYSNAYIQQTMGEARDILTTGPPVHTDCSVGCQISAAGTHTLPCAGREQAWQAPPSPPPPEQFELPTPPPPPFAPSASVYAEQAAER